QRNEVTINADLLVALSRGPGRVRALPFAAAAGEIDLEAENLGANTGRDWSFIPPSQITRRLSPCIDEYDAGELILRVYTPHPPLPPDGPSEGEMYACCPGLLIELEIDNTQSEVPAHGCLGVTWRGGGRIVPMDWTTDAELCGAGYEGRWALAAERIAGEVYTCRDNSIRQHVATGREVIHPGGGDGAILLAVPAGGRRTLRAAVGFYRPGTATAGIEATQLYTDYFDSVEDVCRYVLAEADRIRRDCSAFDHAAADACPATRRREYVSQAIRDYAVNSQLLRTPRGKRLYSVGEGQFCWRNTLDLAADHLPWELWRMPWVVANIFEQFVDRYSYRDEVRFPEDPETYYPGGLCFTHDMGTHAAYAPPGRSGYEMPESTGYSFMTTEELLNGVYLLAGYALATGDADFLSRQAGTARELLESMERRDHHDPARRNGILDGESSMVGRTGREITSYDALDAALKHARGNIYIATKTWTSALLLAATFDQAGDTEAASRARAFAARTAESLDAAFDRETGAFPGNLYEPADSLVLAALEPLAVPNFLGLGGEMSNSSDLLDLLGEHARSCLAGGCIDAQTGALRLSSGSNNSWPSKGVLCVYVMEQVLGIDVDREYPSLMREMLHWAQIAAGERTISDQMNTDSRTVRGGSYYPRMVTSALWLRPVL
ncbi:MAG: glycoside hydrolase family 52 protein, partial [Jiangellaceae bacterium]